MARRLTPEGLERRRVLYEALLAAPWPLTAKQSRELVGGTYNAVYADLCSLERVGDVERSRVIRGVADDGRGYRYHSASGTVAWRAIGRNYAGTIIELEVALEEA